MRSRVYKIDFNGDRMSRLCFGSGTDCGGKRAGTEKLSWQVHQQPAGGGDSEPKTVLARPGEKAYFSILENTDNTTPLPELIFPILSSGDAIGSVILCGKDRESLPGDTEKKLLQVAATYLGREMEN